MLSVIGAVYAPEGQPAPETLTTTEVLVSIRTSGAVAAKVAVIVLGASSSTVSGLADPTPIRSSR